MGGYETQGPGLDTAIAGQMLSPFEYPASGNWQSHELTQFWGNTRGNFFKSYRGDASIRHVRMPTTVWHGLCRPENPILATQRWLTN